MKNKVFNQKRVTLYAVMTAFCMTAIFYFSSQNGSASQEMSDGLLAKIKEIIEMLPKLTGEGAEHDIRKYAHIAEFFGLGLSASLLIHELIRKVRHCVLYSASAAWLCCFIYACMDELHQYFVPGRSSQFTDVLVDSCGFTLGIAITVAIICIMRNFKRRKSNG